MLAMTIASELITQPASEIVEKMSLEEKVGQLFIVPASPERQDYHLQDLKTLIKKFHIGGVIFKQGSQTSYDNLNKFLDSLDTPLPLLKTGDAEWGVSMRITDAVKWPRQLTLSAIQDLTLIEEYAQQVGQECRRVGIALNFAPVTDTNTNPKNPVIGTRSFGDDYQRVALLASTVIRLMQKEGILACAKHFPDHGNVQVDSHKDLPTSQLGSLEAFQAAIKSGVAAIMTAHLEINGKVVTFSPELVYDLLRNKMQFDGLIITDALNMKAITNSTPADEAALQASLAGHDLLLYGHHLSEGVDRIMQEYVPKAIAKIIQAVKEGKITEKDLNDHVIRILNAKQQMIQPCSEPSEPLITKKALELKQRLYDKAVTLVSNKHLPLQGEIRCTFLGEEAKILQSAFPSSSQQGPHLVCVTRWDDEIKQKVKELNPDILVVMASPYGLIDLPSFPTLFIGYDNDPMAQESVKKVLLGEMQAEGKLPIKLSTSN